MSDNYREFYRNIRPDAGKRGMMNNAFLAVLVVNGHVFSFILFMILMEKCKVVTLCYDFHLFHILYTISIIRLIYHSTKPSIASRVY